ncbi:MAG: biotin--[acetyl-CoA-carboxylase] ligase [Chloroflexota bacterium]
MSDALSVESVSAGLKTSFVGRHILYYPALGSTMDAARKEAQVHAPEGTVVLAEEQTAGRGRLRRNWLTPRGSCLAFSLILYPDSSRLPYLIMVASLAVLRGIEAVTGIKPQIKWPNDVLIRGKKVSGILIENELRGSEVAYAVIGIGVNVNLELAGVPEISQVATSLSAELGRPVSREKILSSLLNEFERLYMEPSETVYRAWRVSLITLGKRVRATTPDGVYEGVAESVAADGSLLIRSARGELTRVVAGDVTLRE